MELKKGLSYVSIFLTSITSTFAVKIIDNTQQQQEELAQEGLKSIVVTILTIGILGLMFVLFMFGFAWVLLKIWKKLTEVKKGKNDFLYFYNEILLAQCHNNYDRKLKKRNWKFIWIFWKRQPVYIENEKGMLEVVGSYHGETMKKEGFFVIAIQNKIGMFKFVTQTIIIPSTIKDKVLKKLDVDGKRSIILRCEGLDTLETTDYLYMPLINLPNKKNEFIDFSDMIHKNFIEKVVLKDVIKENLLSSRDMVIKSIETNPYIHFGRRGGKNFEK